MEGEILLLLPSKSARFAATFFPLIVLPSFVAHPTFPSPFPLEAPEELVTSDSLLSEEEPPPAETERGREMFDEETVPEERGRDPEEAVFVESRRADRKKPSRDPPSLRLRS